MCCNSCKVTASAKVSLALRKVVNPIFLLQKNPCSHDCPESCLRRGFCQLCCFPCICRALSCQLHVRRNILFAPRSRMHQCSSSNSPYALNRRFVSITRVCSLAGSLAALSPLESGYQVDRSKHPLQSYRRPAPLSCYGEADTPPFREVARKNVQGTASRRAFVVVAHALA